MVVIAVTVAVSVAVAVAVIVKAMIVVVVVALVLMLVILVVMQMVVVLVLVVSWSWQWYYTSSCINCSHNVRFTTSRALVPCTLSLFLKITTDCSSENILSHLKPLSSTSLHQVSSSHNTSQWNRTCPCPVRAEYARRGQTAPVYPQEQTASTSSVPASLKLQDMSGAASVKVRSKLTGAITNPLIYIHIRINADCEVLKTVILAYFNKLLKSILIRCYWPRKWLLIDNAFFFVPYYFET